MRVCSQQMSKAQKEVLAYLEDQKTRLEEITKMLPNVPEQFSTLSKQIGIVTSVISTQLHDTFIGVQTLWSDADSKPTAPEYLETPT
jgi:hypothetical protein